MKKQHKLNKLVQALTEKKVTHFSMRKSGKRWMTRSVIVLALAGGTGIVATVNPSIFSTIVHALTLPSGSTQIGSIGKAPVIQTDNNSFASMQPLFDAIIGTNQPSFILGDTIDGTGGKAIGWNSNTSLSDSWLTISDADSHTSGASGLSYQTIHYGLGTADGYQDSDKYNYISSKGQTFKVKNVGTAYDTKTKKNVPVSMEVKVNGATYYDSESSSTPRDVFGDGFRLLVAARNNNGNITLGYMVSMDGIPNPGSGQGNEGGGSGGGTGEAIGAASGIPESVNATITMYREDTKENLPEDTLMAMKVSDVDAGQAANVSTNGVHGFIVSKPTNLEIKDNVLTAKGNDPLLMIQRI